MKTQPKQQPTTLKLRNSWKYIGEEQWEWSAFIDDGNTGELNDVDHVEYILHPTFPNPIRDIKDKETKFQMETIGWGTFDLKAFVYKKDGSKLKLVHPIQLEYSPKVGTTPYEISETVNNPVDFKLFESNIKASVINIAQASPLRNYPQVESNAISIVNSILNNANIQAWAFQLKSGNINSDDLKFLIASNDELSKINNLSQAGISQVQLDQFKQEVSSTIVNALTSAAKK